MGGERRRGTGSCEPFDRRVIAVEPSPVMIAGRPGHAATAVRATAEALPFADGSFDAGMALWTIHHWTDPRRGLRELRRVARRVVVIAAGPELNDLWLMRDYFPALAAPSQLPETRPDAIAATLGGATRIARSSSRVTAPTGSTRRSGPGRRRSSTLLSGRTCPDLAAGLRVHRGGARTAPARPRDGSVGSPPRAPAPASPPRCRPANRRFRRCRFKGFAAPACLSSPGRTDFRVASTAHPPGFALLGCPRRRTGDITDVRRSLQPTNCRSLRSRPGARIQVVRKLRGRDRRNAARGCEESTVAAGIGRSQSSSVWQLPA